MKLFVGVLLYVALATGSVIDEFKSFKTRFNKVYSNEAEVCLNSTAKSIKFMKQGYLIPSF